MTQATISQTPFDIPVRRDVKWDFSDVEKKILNDDVLINYLWMGISLGAPGIEKFFINALSPLTDEIKDDKLREDMANMIAQEALHSATHAKFNRALEAAGQDIEASYAEIDSIVEWVAENHTQMEMVGMVSAGEHMLYSFAMIYMKDERIRASMTPATRRLFDYHLMEEAEHGAVSHDIYRYFCGESYWFRVKTAFMAVRLVRKLLGNQLGALIEQGDEKITWRNWVRFISYGFGKPGLFRLMLWNLLEYLSPTYKLTFHERDLELVRRFETEVYATQPENN
ncbi:MAG: metal-dependent hydrolase [Alphaproteobacteria bacterium]